MAGGGFYESMQHMSVMRAFAPRLGGYLSGLVWRLFVWRNGMPGCRNRGLSGDVRWGLLSPLRSRRHKPKRKGSPNL
jgi:hypothetical protein